MRATCHAAEGLCIQYCVHIFLFDEGFAIVLGCKFSDICNWETVFILALDSDFGQISVILFLLVSL